MSDLIYNEKHEFGYACLNTSSVNYAYNEEKKVTIFIPTYKNQHLVLNCVKSCLKQSYKNINVVVVDNGFNECGDSLRIDLMKFDDQRLFYRPNPTNIELQGNFHLILSLACNTSRFIVVPADQHLISDCVETMVAAADMNPSANIVFSQTVVRDINSSDMSVNINSNDTTVSWPHKESSSVSATKMINYYFSRHNINSEWTHFSFIGSLIDGALIKSMGISRPPLFYHGWEELISLYVLSVAKEVAIINRPLLILYTNNERLGWASRPSLNYTRFEPIYAEYYFLENYEPMLIKRGLLPSRLYLNLIIKSLYTMIRYPGVVYLLIPKTIGVLFKTILFKAPIDFILLMIKYKNN